MHNLQGYLLAGTDLSNLGLKIPLNGKGDHKCLSLCFLIEAWKLGSLVVIFNFPYVVILQSGLIIQSFEAKEVKITISWDLSIAAIGDVTTSWIAVYSCPLLIIFIYARFSLETWVSKY